MNQHCFNREELTKFLELEFTLPETLLSANIDTLIDHWEQWHLEFSCFATLLSQVLENKQKYGINVHEVLNNLFLLSEGKSSEIRGLFSIEQIDETFIDSMFDSVRDTNFGIEDNLIEIKRVLYERRY